MSLVSEQAWSQEARDVGASSTSEIIVTATRRAERLEEVPATIAAFEGQQLERSGITRFQDLELVAPGVQISRNGTYSQPAIRGISTSFAGGGQETNVAIYVDGFYTSDGLSMNQDLSNIRSIEVLKGPQGTLYGRNATGGAILINTRAPTDRWEADGNVSFAPRYDDFVANGFVGGPIAPGMSFSVAGTFHKSDGYFRDVNDFSPNVQLDSTTYTFGGNGSVNFAARADRKGNNSAPFKNWSVRPKLRLEPFENLAVTLGYAHTYVNDPRGLAYAQVANNTANPGPAYLPNGAPTTLADPDGYALASRRNETSLNFRPYNASSQDEYNATIALKLGDLGELTSRTAFRKARDFQMFDFDGTPRDAGTAGIFTAYAGIQLNDRDTFIQQLDYTGNFGSFDLLAGLFYYRDKFKAEGYEDVGAVTGPVASFLDFRTRAWAAYIDGTLHLSDRLDLTAGVRYNRDSKQLSYIRYNGAAGMVGGALRPEGSIVPAFTTTCVTGGPDSVLVNLRQAGETADNYAYCNEDPFKRISKGSWTPHAVIKYNLFDRTNAYVSFSRGFKAGTININNPFNSLEPETVSAYEAGIKTVLGAFRGEAAVFYYNYKNNQVSSFNGSTTIVTNSGGAKVYGLDLSLAYELPNTGLNLRAGASLLKARYTDYDSASNATTTSGADPTTPPSLNTTGNGSTGQNLSVIGSWTDRQLIRAPKLTFSVAADYTIDLFGGKLVNSVTVSYSSRFAPQNASYYCSYYTAVAPSAPPSSRPVNQRPSDVAGQRYCDPGFNKDRGRFEEDGYVVVNGQIVWTDPSDRYSIAVFGNNITNTHYKIVSSQQFYGTYEMYNEPRTFGVRLGFKM